MRLEVRQTIFKSISTSMWCGVGSSTTFLGTRSSAVTRFVKLKNFLHFKPQNHLTEPQIESSLKWLNPLKKNNTTNTTRYSVLLCGFYDFRMRFHIRNFNKPHNGLWFFRSLCSNHKLINWHVMALNPIIHTISYIARLRAHGHICSQHRYIGRFICFIQLEWLLIFHSVCRILYAALFILTMNNVQSIKHILWMLSDYARFFNHFLHRHSLSHSPVHSRFDMFGSCLCAFAIDYGQMNLTENWKWQQDSTIINVHFCKHSS